MQEFLQSAIGEEPLIVEGYFDVSPERMFAAWTDPDIVRVWFGRGPDPLHAAEIDLTTGGAWRFIVSADDEKTIGFEGNYLEIKPNEKLVFSWQHFVDQTNGVREVSTESRVDVTFTKTATGTRVNLVHSGIASEDARTGVGGGWANSFVKLTTVVNKD